MLAKVLWLSCLPLLASQSSCEGDSAELVQLAAMRKASKEDAKSLEPNPPDWPASVRIFGPEEVEEASRFLNATAARLAPVSSGKFSSERIAVLLKPGTYDMEVPVGYYTQVLGLGKKPGEVIIKGEKGLYAPSEEGGNNFNTFWKGAENMRNEPRLKKTHWSVSQAAPLRRLDVEGDLYFGEGGSAASEGSGGFIASTRVHGIVDLELQQQWLLRNCEVGGARYYKDPTRSVNFVYLGTTGAPAASDGCTNSPENATNPKPQILVEDTPRVIEKPYISQDRRGKFHLHIPLTRKHVQGLTWKLPEKRVGFWQVFVATNATCVSRINEKLALGRHVVLTPGIYHLGAPLRIGFNQRARNQVLLGLGLATLIPTGNFSAVEVGPADGVRVAGFLLQAGPYSQRLLHWTRSNAFPGLLADVFARVGGPNEKEVTAKVMFEVDGNNVVMDNVWAWRADCCQDGCGTCVPRYCDHGVVVNGDDVLAYGLFSEHCQKDLTVWNGERGTTFFYQSEMDSFARQPWDHTPNYGANGVSGYRVNALEHTGIGIGVYAYFVEEGNLVQAGVVVKDNSTLKSWQCPFFWNLNPSWYENMESGILAISRVDSPKEEKPYTF